MLVADRPVLTAAKVSGEVDGRCGLFTQALVALSHKLDEEEEKTDFFLKQIRRLNERQQLARSAGRRRESRSSSSELMSSTPSSRSIPSSRS